MAGEDAKSNCRPSRATKENRSSLATNMTKQNADIYQLTWLLSIC